LDIVTNGLAPIPHLDLLGLYWNTNKWTPTRLSNYAYGRAQVVNIGVDIEKPSMRMYITDAGFNSPPQSWIEVPIFSASAVPQYSASLTGTTPGPLSISYNQRAASEAFKLEFPSTSASGHYCVIITAKTEFFENDPLSSVLGTPASNFNSYTWLSNNGACGWQNETVISSKQTALKYYNQDATPELFTFEAHAHNVPLGTNLTLEFGNNKPANAPSPQSAKISSAHQVIATQAQVAANTSGDLIVNISNDDLPPEASIDVRMLWHVPVNHPNYLQAIDLLGATRSLREEAPLLLKLGNFILTGK
jgi:hypothetical protein